MTLKSSLIAAALFVSSQQATALSCDFNWRLGDDVSRAAAQVAQTADELEDIFFIGRMHGPVERLHCDKLSWDLRPLCIFRARVTGIAFTSRLGEVWTKESVHLPGDKLSADDFAQKFIRKNPKVLLYPLHRYSDGELVYGSECSYRAMEITPRLERVVKRCFSRGGCTFWHTNYLNKISEW